MVDMISIFPYYLNNENFYALKFIRYIQISFVLQHQDLIYSLVILF